MDGSAKGRVNMDRLIKSRILLDNGDAEYTLDTGKITVNQHGDGLIRRMLDRLWEYEQSGWISVKDRLPELKTDVLMYFAECKNMAVGFMCDRDEDRTMWCTYSDDGWYTDCDYEPLYWMPLPQSPKEGDG